MELYEVSAGAVKIGAPFSSAPETTPLPGLAFARSIGCLIGHQGRLPAGRNNNWFVAGGVSGPAQDHYASPLSLCGRE